MGYMDQTEITNKYDFLDCSEGQELFAPLDFALKNGVHIQEHGKQKELFHYLRRYPTIAGFYATHFHCELVKAHANGVEYYYLTPNPDLKSRIPWTHKHILSKEYVIVALILYKLYYNDCHLELDSISKFQRMVRVDYPELKPGVIRLIAKAKGIKPSETNDKKIDDAIKNAIEEFDKLRWVDLRSDGQFDILPAFHRFTQEYAPHINRIDEILKQE